jgi:phage terminase large subunit-like protein
MAQWDLCVDPELRPLHAAFGTQAWAALDVGLKHDATAICVVGWEGVRIRLLTHSIFVARPGETLDVETVIEEAILSLRSRFALVEVLFDPWQAVHLGQRLQRAGVNMIEYPQHLANLSMMAANLLDMLKTGRLVLYADAELRLAATKTIAIENSRGGWRLGKAKQSDRVDPIIALAMACLACERGGSRVLTDADREFMASANSTLRAQAQAARVSLPGSTVRISSGGLRIVDGAYDYKYRELPPDEQEDRIASVRRGRFRDRGTW